MPNSLQWNWWPAVLAAIVGIAALLDAVPEVLRLEQAARRFYQVMMAALILAGGGMIARPSLQYLSLRTQPVGKGKDLFFGFDQRIDPTGALVETLRDYFATGSDSANLARLARGGGRAIRGCRRPRQAAVGFCGAEL